MPPSVLRLCVAGSGPKVRWRCLGLMPQVVEHVARLDARPLARPSRSRARDSCTCSCRSRPRRCTSRRRDRSPPPRDTIGAPNSRHDRDGRDDVVRVARQHHADRDLAIVRRVGRVQRAVAVVEAHFAAHARAQRRRQLRRRRRRARDRRTASGRGGVGGGACVAGVCASADGQSAESRSSLSDAYSRASARLNSRPSPGRVRSGRSAPSRGVSAPSNSMCSMRA